MFRHSAKAYGFLFSLGLFLAAPALAEPLFLKVDKTRIVINPATAQPALSIDLTPDSGKEFARFTQTHIGKRTTFRVNGKIIATPIVMEPILHGTIQISGAFQMTDLEILQTHMIDNKTPIEVDIDETWEK